MIKQAFQAMVISLAVAMTVTAPLSAAHASGCTEVDYLNGACIGSGSVDIGGSVERPGSGGGGSGGSGGGESGGGSAELPPGVTDGPNGERTVCSLIRPDDCYTITPGELIPGFEPTPAAQPVTIRELISFAPAAPTITTEPDAWGVRGLHTNVIAGASGHTRSGTLLGQTAEVNFIPVGFTIDYGDGTTATSSTGGATWASLGLPEFSKTPTSHRYTTVGTKTITAEVEYAAEYRVGDSGWLPVSGTLSIPTDTPHPIQIVRNATVGVDKPCRPGKPTIGC
ncbi:hypothetical protein ITJ57_04345 [Plantibacter sp. VKM Ac-2880]|uniref:hypothetical protein n=1 Tax=Plantibacter sp. VKM Ac-2880 TaxID=2783827 RepID=UPI00188F6812|nr:hypothetical protein [Plantibacter sp. VKM Ac-2880]MBF4567992.1 hypothetical protein [Plantibacter sp. VKM Ac-2880]